MTDGLPALLRYEDRNSMAFGIEARVPFLDYRLIEYAVKLPDRLRVDRGLTKAVLRRAMHGRLPEAILARRDKMGFAAPQHQWLAAGLAEVAGLVRGGQIVRRGWVKPAEVERVLAAGSAGRRGTEQLWRLFIMEAWLRETWPEPSDARRTMPAPRENRFRDRDGPSLGRPPFVTPGRTRRCVTNATEPALPG